MQIKTLYGGEQKQMPTNNCNCVKGITHQGTPDLFMLNGITFDEECIMTCLVLETQSSGLGLYLGLVGFDLRLVSGPHSQDWRLTCD